jgi:hypothetical protein
MSIPGNTDELIAQLQAQQALQTAAIAALLAGNLDGPGSAKAYLLALNPTLQVTPAAFEFGA